MPEWGRASSVVFTELERCVVVTCPSALSPVVLEELRAQTLTLCSERVFKAVIFDLSAVALLDLTEWETLRALSAGVKMMGAESWLVGLKPSVASALIIMNADIDGLRYAMGVEDALEVNRQR